MTPADHARTAAISLEAKKDRMAQRQSNDWAVTFTVQGSDMDARLTQAPMGTRYAMVLVEIGDDEQPVNRKEAMPNPHNKPAVASRLRQADPPSSRPDGAKRNKMDWRDVQPAAQAGIRSNEPEFWAFLREVEEYADVHSATTAAAAIRDLCGVKSRADLSIDHRKRVLWHQTDARFREWQMKERVGA